MKSVLVTGAAGFIGSHLVHQLLSDGYRVLSVDALSYAGRMSSLGACLEHPMHAFLQLDLTDRQKTLEAVTGFSPDWIFHLAAETHVDRSIADPMKFFHTNVLGTGHLLEAAAAHQRSGRSPSSGFRFIHVSTDEVYGSAGESDECSDETSPYRPRSPYAASKAASDHMVRAWSETYGLPAIVTQSSNNYGPRQFPEKLIPMTITRARSGSSIPIYGDGRQMRDWLHVEDHVRALTTVAQRGHTGQTYLICGRNEWRNLDLVILICDWVGEFLGKRGLRDQIEFVTDRPGHDFRYAVNDSKIRDGLGWMPRVDFMAGLRETVEWYCSQPDLPAELAQK